MTSLIERLVEEGTRQVMEYEEESAHNVSTAAQNAHSIHSQEGQG